MKKTLLVSVALLSTLISFGKDDDDRLNAFRGGYQMSNLLKNGDKGENDLGSFYIGFVRQKKITPLFRFETGLEYMIAGGSPTDNSELKLHYLVLPVQLHFKLGPFIATGGLNADFKVNQELTINGEDVDITDANKATFMDCAADLGVGFKILFITAEARYYWGLVDIYDGWSNQYLQLGLKVNF